MVALLAVGQSNSCPGVNKITMKDMGKTGHIIARPNISQVQNSGVVIRMYAVQAFMWKGCIN